MAAVKKYPLMWTEGIRALICMLPMLVAAGVGKTSYLVALGQGGFYFSSLFLPKRITGRAIMGSLVVGLGLGFYLIGGNVVQHEWTALLFTFFVSIILSFMGSWRLGGALSLSFIMIYTAGINSGSPEKAAANFLLFAGVMLWSALISMLPVWEPLEPPPVNPKVSDGQLAEQGVRMGIGTTLALAVSYMFSFYKLGWAPSAVGNVVRYDGDLSKKRAWGRFYGTLGGALMAVIALSFSYNINILVSISVIFAILNGIFKKTKLGAMPLFYTATILILYSANDPANGSLYAWQRLAYNLVGITLGMLVVLYPFPKIVRGIKKIDADVQAERNNV